MIIPSSDRYGVMLKTISEEFLPKRIQIVTDAVTEAETRGTVAFMHSLLSLQFITYCLLFCPFILLLIMVVDLVKMSTIPK